MKPSENAAYAYNIDTLRRKAEYQGRRAWMWMVVYIALLSFGLGYATACLIYGVGK